MKQDIETLLPDKLCFTEREAADLLSIPWYSLRDLRLSGKIRASRLGKRIVYSRESLLTLLDETME